MPATRSASSASSTAPGPTGIPAARSARAKYNTFSARRPVGWFSLLVERSAGIMTLPARGRLLGRPQLRFHLVEQLLDLGAFQPRDIVLIFEQHTERVGNGGRIERDDVELGQRAGPIQRFGDTRRLEQVLVAQPLHEADDLLRQLFADARHLLAHDGKLAVGVRIADPVIEAATLERIVHFT